MSVKYTIGSGGGDIVGSGLCSLMPHSRFDMETPFKWLYGKGPVFFHLEIVDARTFVRIKDAKKLKHKP